MRKIKQYKSHIIRRRYHIY